MSRARLWALLGLCLSAGCPKHEPSERALPDAALAPAHAAPDAGSRGKGAAKARKLHPAPRVKSLVGDVPGVAADQPLGAIDVKLYEKQELVLDFSAGARVHAFGPALLRGAAAEQDALLARDATLSVDLPPAAATPDSGFLLSTPSAAVSLVRSGCFVLRDFGASGSVLWVISGSATVSAGGAAFQPLDKPLAAGERLEISLDGKLARGRHDLRTLEDAERAALKQRAAKGEPPELAVLDQDLRTSLGELTRAREHERELLAAHRSALADAGTERMALQAELALHAASLSRARARLRTALAQRSASRLGTELGLEDRLSREARLELDPSP